MSRRLICLTCLVWGIAALPAATEAQVENLLQNQSFEEDEVIFEDAAYEGWWTWGWEAGLSSNAEIDETDFVDGTKSLRIHPLGGTNWYFIVANSPIILDTSKNYTVSFWAKAEEPRPLTVALKATDNSINAWGATDFELTTEWAEYNYQTEALTESVKLEIWCAASDATMWLDFVNVYEGDYVPGIGPGPGSRQKAARPDPADGAVHPDTWVNLTWRPGDGAVSHDVYLGDNLDDVSSGAEAVFVGNQSVTFATAGFPGFPFPDGLVPGTTYYWRVDEVNEADPNSPWQGDVWSFSLAPETAYNPVPADGADSVALDSRVSWAAGFASVLHTVYIDEDYETVSNAAGGLPQAGTSFKPASLEAEKIYYWRVDEFDSSQTHKGEIWSFATPGAIANPQPANGAADVQTAATLSWTAADNAASSELYFGTDADAVKNAEPSSPEYVGNKALGSESYDPGGLDLATTYHWRVDSVYPDKTVKGLAWSFTIADFITVDDFESYNDIEPPDPASNRIFDKWIDGFGTTTNGALVGNDMPPYAERTIVHGGEQSLIYSYDNNLKTSEATLTL
ncbi:MAG: carbohydrate binding domain-containing protein, partial [Planctomycetota bacterium]